MKTRRVGLSVLAGLAVLLGAAQASAQLLPSSWDKLGVPDFSQSAREEWGNSYCAPTAVANSIWYYSTHGYSGLTPGLQWEDDDDATAVIQDLGTRMGTTNPGGTNPGSMRDGWQNYCNHYYPQSGWPHFATRLLWVEDFDSSPDFWEYMKEELWRCEDVVPLVYWHGGGGHAVTMVGWTLHYDEYGNPIHEIVINDPATGGDQHNWNGEYRHVGIESFADEGINLDRWVSGYGRIEGFVVTSPVPEPCVLGLLGGGLVVLFVYRYRRRAQS
jgi:hypothetical protein